MHIGAIAHSPGQTFAVSVLAGGKEKPLYSRPQDGKIFVVGQPGEVYELRVRNRTAGRIETICAIDGRNVLKDEPGDVQENHGMVFVAGTAGKFDGWRVNDGEVREFVFGQPEHTIAAQATGNTSNIGVIGFATYREHSPYTPPAWTMGGDDVYRGGLESVDQGPGDASFATRERVTRGSTRGGIGTGAGEVRHSRVRRVDFNRQPGEPDVLVIGYDAEHYLRQQGIIAPPEPKAFPGIDTGYGGYRSMT